MIGWLKGYLQWSRKLLYSLSISIHFIWPIIVYAIPHNPYIDDFT